MSAPHLPKRSSAIRHLERNEYFQATVSVWSYADRLDTSSRIEDVTSGQGPEAFGWSRRFIIGCKSLQSVPRGTISARTTGESGSVIDHASRLSPLLAGLDKKRESRFGRKRGADHEKFSRKRTVVNWPWRSLLLVAVILLS